MWITWCRRVLHSSDRPAVEASFPWLQVWRFNDMPLGHFSLYLKSICSLSKLKRLISMLKISTKWDAFKFCGCVVSDDHHTVTHRHYIVNNHAIYCSACCISCFLISHFPELRVSTLIVNLSKKLTGIWIQQQPTYAAISNDLPCQYLLIAEHCNEPTRIANYNVAGRQLCDIMYN